MVINPDEVWDKIVLSEGNDKQLVKELHCALLENIQESKLFVMLTLLKQLINSIGSIRILDYGCGGGQLLSYLRVLGYENLTGIDVNAEKIKAIRNLYSNIGFEQNTFFIYDGASLPFDSSSFDIIISQQVIEHVHNVELYFSEGRRVLSLGGKILLDFPHRLIPYDTHTKMWFVHYLPLKMRGYFYDKYCTNSAEVYANFLYLKTVWFYKGLLDNMFSSIIDMTESRLSEFTYKKHYEGNLKLRCILDKFMNAPLVGKYIRKFLSNFANTTLIITK
jgi:SAM-dependent methyltransferase